jgi:hypothetical protein
MVKRGHTPGRVAWYLDGAEVARSAVTPFGEQTLNFDDTRPFFGVGDFPSGQYQAHGAVDEVAIWHRARTDAELAALSDRQRVNLINAKPRMDLLRTLCTLRRDVPLEAA